jgi:XRE family aerobic/anaerobic benzoate catabolism transcriptional regulator
MAASEKDPFLIALGERVRLLRSRRGLTRKSVAKASGVSERHLANLEYGIGNASILVLRQVAGALACSLAELVGDETTRSPDWLLLREQLRGRSERTAARARRLAALFGVAGGEAARARRLALIGCAAPASRRSAASLAEALDVPFVELSREVERIAGCSIREIHDLYGSSAYHRYERRALDETCASTAAVIATPGGIVAEPATFNALLASARRCGCRRRPRSTWRASPRRATRGRWRRPRGDGRPAADPRRPAPFYAKADALLDTPTRARTTASRALLAKPPRRRRDRSGGRRWTVAATT